MPILKILHICTFFEGQLLVTNQKRFAWPIKPGTLASIL